MDIKETTVAQLGTARQVKVDKENTTIVEGGGDPSEIKARINSIKVQIEDTTSDYDREKLQERLAKLAGGVAVIAVGAATEVEMKEVKLRIEDALNATRAAVQEGIVPGGGVALINVLSTVQKLEEGKQRRQKGPVSRSWFARLRNRCARSPAMQAVKVRSSSKPSRPQANPAMAMTPLSASTA